jgi:hypothetical protein
MATMIENPVASFDTMKSTEVSGDTKTNYEDLQNTDRRTQMMKYWDLPVPPNIGDAEYDYIDRIANSLKYYSTPHPSTTSKKKTNAYINFMKALRAYIGYITRDSGMAATCEINFVVSNTRRFFKGKRITVWVSFGKNKPFLLMHWSSDIGFQPIV